MNRMYNEVSCINYQCLRVCLQGNKKQLKGVQWFATAVINTMIKRNLGRKGIIWFTLEHHGPWSRKARSRPKGRSLNRDPGGTLLSESFPLACSATWPNQTCLLRDAAASSDLDPHRSISSWKGALLLTFSQTNLIETCCLSWTSFFLSDTGL